MLVGKIKGTWEKVKILQTHLPAGKRPLSYSVMVIEDESTTEGKCYLIPATDTKHENQ